MDLNAANFNRIIDLTLYTSTGRWRKIICPRKGRKPSIEINATYANKEYLQVFNIAIRNLYLDLHTEQYARVKVSAGYAGNLVDIEGSIMTMYQDEPGPEGKTIIQCQLGKVAKWLDGTVQLNYKAGTSLREILEAIKPKLGASKVYLGLKAKTLVLKSPFEFDGKASAALGALQKKFQEDNLSLITQESQLCGICLAAGDTVGYQVLRYMSAPPQENTGGDAGTYYTTITAPWMPKLSIGDLLMIPARVYVRNFNLVGGLAKTQKIQVTAISFQFSTTGSANKMTVQGFLVR